jgi:hypothetical protein
MKPAKLLKYLHYCIGNHYPVLIPGPPGVGKSDIVAHVCKILNIRLLVTHPVVSDPTDYRGLPFPNKDRNGADFLPFGDLKILMETIEELVFLIDDLGQAPISVQAAIMQLVLTRQINGHKISDKVTFIAATNRKEDRAGVSGVIEPLIRRFYLAKLDVDWKDWFVWAAENNMPPQLMSFIAWKPELLNNPSPGKAIENTYCPRTIAMLGQLYNSNCPDELLQEAAEGAVGPEFSYQYFEFLRLIKKLPTVDSVLDDPQNALIPPENGSKYAFTISLANRMDEDTMPKITEYLYRLPSELNVCCMTMATSQNPELQNTETFIEWTEKMHDDIFQNQ